MKAEYVNAFLEPAIFVIEKVLKIEATIGQIKKGSGINLKDPISIIIGMNGDLKGVVILGFTMETAYKIAAKMLQKDNIAELNQDEKEALSELANMIIGNAGGKLYELGLTETLTPPTVVIGSQVSFSIPQINQSIIVPINTKIGTLDMNLFLKDDRKA